MLDSYYKLQQKPKTVPEFKNTLQLIWFALPGESHYNSVKDFHKLLQAVYQPYNAIIHIIDTTDCFVYLNVIWFDLF